MRTTAADGTRYSVTRRWLPWRRRIQGDDDGTGSSWAPDLGGGHDLGDDPISAVIGLVLLLVAIILFAPAVLVAIGVALEVALLLLLLPLAVLARVLFGHPWEVEVRLRDTEKIWPVVHTEEVKGWRASSARIAEISEQIRSGGFPEGARR